LICTFLLDVAIALQKNPRILKFVNKLIRRQGDVGTVKTKKMLFFYLGYTTQESD